jgi:hypothetical protein
MYASSLDGDNKQLEGQEFRPRKQILGPPRQLSGDICEEPPGTTRNLRLHGFPHTFPSTSTIEILKIYNRFVPHPSLFILKLSI